MKASDILTLLQAGYTKAEISALDADPAAAPAPAAPAPAAAEAPAAPAAPAPAAPAAQDPAAQLLAAINGLTATLQSGAMFQPQPAAPAKTAEDILAECLFPGAKK